MSDLKARLSALVDRFYRKSVPDRYSERYWWQCICCGFYKDALIGQPIVMRHNPDCPVGDLAALLVGEEPQECCDVCEKPISSQDTICCPHCGTKWATPFPGKRMVGEEPAADIWRALKYWEGKKYAVDAVRPNFTSDQLRELEAGEARLLALAGSPRHVQEPAADPQHELLADLRELQSLYDSDRVAQPHARQIERIFDKWLSEKVQSQEPAADHPEPLKGNWHAIEGPNGLCACGPDEGCPERLARHIRQQIDFWQAKANFLERERERTLDELPDAWQRVPGSLALKVRAFREFAEPYISASTQSKVEAPATDQFREWLSSRAFYDLMQTYRHAWGGQPSETVEAFEAVKAAILAASQLIGAASQETK